MSTTRKLTAFPLAIVFALSSLSCSVVKDMQSAMANVARLKFRLDSVSGFSLGGVPLSGRTSLGVMEGVNLLAAFGRNELPASFTLNIAAVNPNDGTGGSPKATATLTSLAWTLLLDNTLTINGDISSPITIPGTGQQSIIPLTMKLDLAKFFKDKGYENVVNLALALGGANSSPARITLRAKPTVKTDFGPINFPGEIDIVEKELR